jgi:2-dehydropantoate 2-reductase
MHILVFGAGAVGSLLGGFLARAGHSVTLVGRAGHMAAIRHAGLRITGIWGAHRVTNLACTDSPASLHNASFDVILVTVKSYDTAAALGAIRDLARPSTSIVSVQNGYGNTEAIEACLGRGRVFGARIITGVELLEDGHVDVTVTADDIRLGPPAGELGMMAEAEALAVTFRNAGVPVSATDKFRAFLWAKILYNCALNPLGALVRATYGELASDPGTRQLIDCIIDECFLVIQSQKVALFWEDAAQYRQHFFEELIPPTARHYPSMLRDLERRGRTEIDALNGAIVRLAQPARLAVPVNQTLTSMIQLREQTRRRELEGRT